MTSPVIGVSPENRAEEFDPGSGSQSGDVSGGSRVSGTPFRVRTQVTSRPGVVVAIAPRPRAILCHPFRMEIRGLMIFESLEPLGIGGKALGDVNIELRTPNFERRNEENLERLVVTPRVIVSDIPLLHQLRWKVFEELRLSADDIRCTPIHIQSPMQRLQHGLRVGFRDAQEGAGGAFGAAVALFPVLEGAGADADERGELDLAEAEFFAHGLGIGRLEGGAACRVSFFREGWHRLP